jgi:hypothetical protein
MGFLDNLSKSIGQGIDRAKFEADKFQKVTRIQNEIFELKKQIDAKRLEFGDRAYELYKAGQIQSATLAEIQQNIEALRASVTLKEEELKTAQAEVFVEPTPSSGVQAQQVPISVEQPSQPPAAQPSTQATGTACPNCGFQVPPSAMFCPNCGARMGV